MTTPKIISAALFERDERVLTAHRKQDCPPFAGQWLVPMTPVRASETAEDAVKRYAREQFGVDVARESFVDTVYMLDPDDEQQYIANIFRADLAGAPMRFRADGDYDDARWLAASELEQLWMPPSLREPLVRIMTDPQYAPDTDWTLDAPSDAVPLAEREVEAPPPATDHADIEEAPAPDNRAAWEAISAPFQKAHDFIDPLRLRWSTGVYEDDLRLLGDIAGRHALVLGSGAGHDVIALAAMGAIATGIDQAPKQVTHGRELAARHRAENASFMECAIEDLTRFDDASFEVVISIHALEFVERLDAALAEAARALKPGGALAIAVHHPFDQALADAGPPYRVGTYWRRHIDRDWAFEDGPTAIIRTYVRTVQDWFCSLDEAGFVVERIVEPRPGATMEGSDDARARAAAVPLTLIMKARKR